MTTLAIIGAGIAGRTFLYTLAKSQKKFDKIIVFYSETFAPACSFNSTAIVAPRGISPGHSPLGDLLVEAFATFRSHVEIDSPLGVTRVLQHTAVTEKLDQFRKRYPMGSEQVKIQGIDLSRAFYVATEDAFMIDPPTYLQWLADKANENLTLDWQEDFVVNMEEGKKIELKTHHGKSYEVDEVVFTTGAQTGYWGRSSSRPVQGSYLEFNVRLGLPSCSLTLNGDNFIYDDSRSRLLTGSTTKDGALAVAPEKELKEIYQRLSDSLKLELPSYDEATIKLGIREKAPRREPYFEKKNNITWLGGLYKNGYSTGLLLSRRYSNGA